MKWYNYSACFFAGASLVNCLPHFIHGIDGDAFPTPFAKPPGTGLSSPLVNICWALANLAAGYLLIRAGRLSTDNNKTIILFFIGIALISVLFSIMAPSILVNYKSHR